MAEEVTQKIIEVGIGNSAKTLGELREAVLQAKEAQDKLKESIGENAEQTEAYQQAIVQTKAAMDQYNSEMRIQVKSVEAVKGSYNDLVAQLARAKEEWKTLDMGSAAWQDAQNKVVALKEQIADLDHGIGNWQSNVGNYSMAASASLGSFGEGLEKASAANNSLAGSVKNASMAMKLMSTNPIMGLIQLLLPIIIRIVQAAKENNAVMEAGKKVMSSFEPILAIINKLFEKLAVVISKVAEWAGKLIGKVVSAVTGVKEEVKEATEEVVESMAEPAVIEKAEDAAEQIAKAFSKVLIDDIEDEVDIVGVTEKELKEAIKAEEKALQQMKALRKKREDDKLAAIDRDEKRALAYNDVMLQTDREREQAAFDIQASAQQRRLEALQQFQADALAANDVGAYLDYQQQVADLEVEIEVEKQRRLNQERKEAYDTYIGFAVAAANAVAGVMGEVASAYEDEISRRIELGEITESEGRKQFEVVKGMQIGVATMQMLAGITAALSGAFTTKSGPWDIALAAIQAASIAASGIINIAKIKNTQFSAGGGGGSASVTPAVQAAPTVTTDVPQTRVVTNAEDEQTLNERMQAQRVYVVYSDIEGAGRQVQVQQQESSF